MSKPFHVNVETHVIALLDLARLAIEAADALRVVDGHRKLLPSMDEAMKLNGILTDLGESVADSAALGILTATHLLQHYLETDGEG